MGNKQFRKITGYKNIDKLTADISPHSYRVTKKECLDLPDKIYQQIYVEMSKEQKKAYMQLKEHAITMIEDKLLTAANAITLMIKLHQIVCGNVYDDEGNVTRLPCPRLDTLKQILERTNGKVIIWAVFKEDIRRISEMLGEKAVCYYGEIRNSDRELAIRAFQTDERIQYFIANEAASRGLTLTSSSSSIYYSNSYKLETRLQSEDRNHRIGQTESVTYTDLICRGTVDERIIDALRGKKNLSDSILDNLGSII